jgi:NADPH:quinone reductase-like Zn-dependent oxidoreductase
LTADDLQTAMGRSAKTVLGIDVYGRVGKVGNQVTTHSSQDRVCALVQDGVFQDAHRVNHRLVLRHQSGFIPSLHTSAYHGLVVVGRASPGKTVLIRGGTSPAGLAAIDVGLIAGAEILATVSGADSEWQKKVLICRGLPIGNILDAKSVSLVEVVRSLTSGKGVDVVYNPLQQDIETDYRCIRSCKCAKTLYESLSLTLIRWQRCVSGK